MGILSYLWGIETKITGPPCVLVLGILSYLWGIETRPCCHWSSRNRGDFILPMRNWNKVWADPEAPEALGFYLTYEELKQFNRTSGGVSSVGFYLTYEELKPVRTSVSITRTRGFYLTYEELKHVTSTRFAVPPVRILSYLWGIETRNLYAKARKW